MRLHVRPLAALALLFVAAPAWAGPLAHISTEDAAGLVPCGAAATPLAGCAQWTLTWDGAPRDILADVAQGADGSVLYATGSTFAAPSLPIVVTGGSSPVAENPDLLTLAIDATAGQVLWSARLDGGSVDLGVGVLVGADGVVRVAAIRIHPGTGPDFALLSFDPTTGAFLGEATALRAPGTQMLFAASPSPSGEVAYLTGSTTAPGVPNSYRTLAVDLATGAVLWEAVTRHGDVLGRPVAVLPDAAGGRVYVAGSAWPQNTPHALVEALDAATGAVLWSALRPLSSDEALLLEDSDPLAVLPGAVVLGSPAETAAFDPATGAELWAAPTGGLAKAVAAADGRVLVAESRMPALGLRMLDAASGAVLWDAEPRGPRPAAVRDLAFGTDGRLAYLAGSSGAGHAVDALALAVDAATGQLAWEAAGGAGTHDAFLSLLPRTDGALVVAGHSGAHASTHADALVQSYLPSPAVPVPPADCKVGGPSLARCDPLFHGA